MFEAICGIIPVLIAIVPVLKTLTQVFCGRLPVKHWKPECFIIVLLLFQCIMIYSKHCLVRYGAKLLFKYIMLQL